MPAAERGALMQKFVNTVRARVEDIGSMYDDGARQALPTGQRRNPGLLQRDRVLRQEARRLHGMVIQSDVKDKFVYVLRRRWA